MTESEFNVFFKNKYRKTSSFTSGIALMLSDCLMVMLSIGTSFFIINLINHSWINFRSFVEYWIYLPPTLVVFYAAGLYPGISLPPADEVKKFSICSFFIFTGIALSITVEDADEKLPLVVALILAVPIALVLLPSGREFARHVLSKSKSYGVPAIIFTNGNSADFIIDRLLKRPDLGYKPALIIKEDASHPSSYCGIPVFPPTNEIKKIIDDTRIKVAIICNWHSEPAELTNAFRYSISIPKPQDINSISTNIRDFGGILVYSSTNNLTKKFSLFIKRTVDLLILLVSSPFVLPLVLVVSLLIKLSGPGPVFYGHKRIGKNGKEFKCWKFRSMNIRSQEMLEEILATDPVRRAEWEAERKFKDDPRVTKFGKILRKTSLDELPQLINVLLGQMSFVGPRPVTESETEKYGSYKDYVLSVLPGLSGMWQISGRSETSYEERIYYDTYYIQNWSVWLDIWILIKTVGVVLIGKGAY